MSSAFQVDWGAVNELFARLGDEARSRLRPSPPPEWAPPMLATLTDHYFSDPAWIFERKLDGERCLAFCLDGKARLLSRSRQHLDNTYPEIVDGLARQGTHDIVVDGEVVALERGQTSFALLQQRLGVTSAAAARKSPVAVYYYIFDVLHIDGYDTTALALRDRKALLRKALRYTDPLRFTSHRNAEGEAYFHFACAHGWEGLVAKRASSTYVSRRSPDWLKFKCSLGQEFVIGGFTDPAGSRVGMGALLVGYYDDRGLAYAGKVGTGFSTATLLALRSQLEGLEIANSPFTHGRIAERAVHWVRPVLVAQVVFSEWTREGKLRHPRFEGLRRDKEPGDVRRERPVSQQQR
jgi:bifunctional non-homologous end joining protein LigD